MSAAEDDGGEQEKDKISEPSGGWSEPDSMVAIDQLLRGESAAPQWTAAAAAAAATADLPQRVTPLSLSELAELEKTEEEPWPLSEYERELLQRSLDSLDYLGDWANPNNAKDSIVLTCNKPDVHVASNGIEEFTCAYDDFTLERHQLHSHIVARMLTSSRTTSGAGPFAAAADASKESSKRRPPTPMPGGPPEMPLPQPGEQHGTTRPPSPCLPASTRPPRPSVPQRPSHRSCWLAPSAASA